MNTARKRPRAFLLYFQTEQNIGNPKHELRATITPSQIRCSSVHPTLRTIYPDELPLEKCAGKIYSTINNNSAQNYRILLKYGIWVRRLRNS